MDWYQVGTLALAVLALVVVVAINAGSIRAMMMAFQSEAAADRRSQDAKMDVFRMEMRTFGREMHRLAERQARVEGAGD